MSVFTSLSYIPGFSLLEEIPLQRFLPTIPSGIFQTWLHENIDPSRWLIDPFGSSPFLPLEAQKNGSNILVVCNNPILQLYLEVLATAPREKDFHNALSIFAKEKHQIERLETHLKSLYITKCPNCTQLIPAKGFIWIKNTAVPTSKLIYCKYCGTEGEFPITEDDIHQLDNIGKDVLYRTLAIQRANINPQTLSGTEDVINTYTARALYFLMSIINRMDRIRMDVFHKNLLYALLIHALDLGNSIWSWPTSRTRPKQINIPAQYIEHNLWHVLEDGISLWTQQEQPVPFTIWPVLPEKPGICLYKGRITGLENIEELLGYLPSTAITIFPRPNQAFWSLSTVWSGWLFGRKAAIPMKSGLERKRFDWYWFSKAIHQSLLDVSTTLDRDAKIFGLIPDNETGFTTAVLTSAAHAGFALDGIAMRGEHDIIQCVWKKQRSPSNTVSPKNQAPISRDIHTLFDLNNEPIEAQTLYTAILADQVQNPCNQSTEHSRPYFAIKNIQQDIITLMKDPKTFEHYPATSNISDHELFWLTGEIETSRETITDQVENAVFEILSQEATNCTLDTIDIEICRRFSGLLTPDRPYLKTCLQAYGSELPEKLGSYRVAEEVMNFDSELHAVKNVLEKTGQMLGFTLINRNDIAWHDDALGQTVFHFHLIQNACISKLVFSQIKNGAARQIIVYPDRLLALMTYKLGNNPRLSTACTGFGKVITLSQIIRFFENRNITLQDFNQMLDDRSSGHQHPSQISIFK
jgi:hypothetical protein